MKELQVWRHRGGARLFLFLIAVLSAFFSYEIGNRCFADPDEGRYVEISREMVSTGGYVTPRLDGLKYFEKPALFYWMQSLAIKAFGINETSMRLWPLVFAVLGCLFVFFVCARYYSDATGFFAVGILATNILYYAHSRLIILDLVSAVLISGALWSFFVGFVKETDRRTTWLLLTYAFSAIACLCKGLIGAVLPGVVVFSWMLITNNWKKLKEILAWRGIGIFLAIFLPWHILVSLRNRDFLHFYFIVEHFLRYTTTIHARYQPSWFFLPILGIGLMPWTGYVLVALKNTLQKAMRRDSEEVFLSCWILGILAFFSFSHSKLIPYILPIVPPIALVTAKSLCRSIDQDEKDFYLGSGINVVLIVASIAGYFSAKSHISGVLQNSDVHLLLNACLCTLALLVVAMITAVFRKKDRLLSMFIFLFFSANLMWIINKAAPYYQNEKKPTTKQMAHTIAANRSNGDLVFCYKRYYQDFPVYLNDCVGIVDFVGELEFGAKAEKNNNKIISEEDFWELWRTTDKRVFLLLSRANYRQFFVKQDIQHKILDFDKHFIAITNK